MSHLHYLFICKRIFRLFQCLGSCIDKERCYEYSSVSIFLNYSFVCPGVGLLGLPGGQNRGEITRQSSYQENFKEEAVIV